MDGFVEHFVQDFTDNLNHDVYEEIQQVFRRQAFLRIQLSVHPPKVKDLKHTREVVK